MTKRMAVITVGYREYAMSQTDAMALMSIAQRAVPVSGTGFREPYQRSGEPGDDAFASRMEIASVETKTSAKRIPKSHRISYDG